MKHLVRPVVLVMSAIAAAACSDNQPVQPRITPDIQTRASAAFQCSANTGAKTLSCSPMETSAIRTGDVRSAVIIGGQYLNVWVMTGGPPQYLDSIGEFRFNLSMQNLMAQPMGTLNGITRSGAGLKVFIVNGPTVTGGSGVASVISDGTSTFTAPNQPFYEYNGNIGVDSILSPGEFSSPRIWRFLLPPNITFTFTILISTDVPFPASGQGGALFQRYIALGGANAAGFSSAGIVDSLQDDSYPAQLAARAGAVFSIPFVKKPGCPPPVTQFAAPPNPIVQPCGLSILPPPAIGQNAAVPGTKLAHLLNRPLLPPVSIWNTLLLHGTYSQIQRAQFVHPTFATIGAGDEDVLAAALIGRLGPLFAGEDSALTRASSFDADYNSLMTQLVATGSLLGSAMIGVLDPITYDPVLQPGAFFFLARDATGRFNGMPVNSNCSPVNALGQPNPLSNNMVSFAIFASPDSAITQINCDPAVQNGTYLLDQTEIQVIHDRVAQFNTIIQNIATSRNAVFINPNTVFAGALTSVDSNGRYQQIRKCQLLPTATTAAQFQAAVLRSCPIVLSGFTAPNVGGSVFSLDGTTLSASAQRTLTIALANAINARYSTSISTVP